MIHTETKLVIKDGACIVATVESTEDSFSVITHKLLSPLAARDVANAIYILLDGPATEEKAVINPSDIVPTVVTLEEALGGIVLPRQAEKQLEKLEDLHKIASVTACVDMNELENVIAGKINGDVDKLCKAIALDKGRIAILNQRITEVRLFVANKVEKQACKQEPNTEEPISDSMLTHFENEETSDTAGDIFKDAAEVSASVVPEGHVAEATEAKQAIPSGSTADRVRESLGNGKSTATPITNCVYCNTPVSHGIAEAAKAEGKLVLHPKCVASYKSEHPEADV